jgi:hypothetical protein
VNLIENKEVKGPSVLTSLIKGFKKDKSSDDQTE